MLHIQNHHHQHPEVTMLKNDKILSDIKIDPTTIINPKSNATPNLPLDSKSNPNTNCIDVKKKIEKQTFRRSSSPLSINQPNVSNASLPLSPPSTPLPFASARNHSFSSSSIQSATSDQLLDHSHLKPGQNASLLSYSKTINMYRENAKKTNNMEIQCDFAIFLVEAAKRLQQKDNEQIDQQQQQQQQHAYLIEAEKLLKQVAMRGHSESQYYLANMYAAGLLNKTGKPDFDKSFPLFVQSAKHHHPDAAYRYIYIYL